MSSSVRLSTADARALRGLIKAFQPAERVADFERAARASPGAVELPLTLYPSVWGTLSELSSRDRDRQLQLEGVYPEDVPALLIRLGLPVTYLTLDPAGHSVWSLHMAGRRVQFHFLYTPAGTGDDALQAFRIAFFPDFSTEEWAAWQRWVRLQPGRFAHPRLNPYDPELSLSYMY